jgi:excisionase family DNA binding protein
MDEILKRLQDLHNLVENQGINAKEVLNMVEASKYLELSVSHLYKLTSTGLIPHYKPNGKKLYFKRTELDAWLLRNRSVTKDEIEQEAANYLVRKGRVRV